MLILQEASGINALAIVVASTLLSGTLTVSTGK